MSNGTLAQLRYFEYTPPVPGASYVVATSNAAASFDLRTIAVAAPSGGAAITSPSSQQQFIDVQNDGGTTIYVAFGVTAPTPVIATVGLNQPGACYAIPANTTKRWYLRPNYDNFIGFIAASGTPTLRLFISSRA